jgi:hypothetical protein
MRALSLLKEQWRLKTYSHSIQNIRQAHFLKDADIFLSLVALLICFLNKKTTHHIGWDNKKSNAALPLMFFFSSALFPAYLSTDTYGSFQTSSLHHSPFFTAVLIV